MAQQSKEWESHMAKKSATTKGNTEIKKPAKKASVAPAKGPVKIAHHAKTEAAKAAVTKAVSIEEKLVDMEILRHPLVTEKAVNMIEGENKLTFVVDGKANKIIVRKAVESMYQVKVTKVNIVRDTKGRKRAIVTLDKNDKNSKAGEVATKLGVI